jgi:phosphohistidine swiveling domain-containing protein/CRISPR/Cas system-associated endoribonuclease Cas2
VLKIRKDKKALNLFFRDLGTIKKNLKKFTEINTLFEEHQREYFWQQNSYLETEVLPIDFFIKQVKDLIKINANAGSIIKNNENRLRDVKIEKEKILKDLSLDDKYKKLIKLLDFFCIFQDDRKAISLKGHKYLSLFVNGVSRRTGINKNLLYWSTPYEVPSIIKGKFNVDELRKRQEHTTLIIDIKGMIILSGRESMKKEKEVLGMSHESDVSEFEGMRAQGGKVQGEIIKVLDPRKCENFKSGSILVTTMTSPDFVPLIKKASAIITDEGGITSHAAIVARELGVPCVIGTKIATEILSDGDLVEVNANHGIIRRLK